MTTDKVALQHAISRLREASVALKGATEQLRWDLDIRSVEIFDELVCNGLRPFGSPSSPSNPPVIDTRGAIAVDLLAGMIDDSARDIQGLLNRVLLIDVTKDERLALRAIGKKSGDDDPSGAAYQLIRRGLSEQ